MLQMSGSGLVAPCGALFNEKYKNFTLEIYVKQDLKIFGTQKDIGLE